VNAVSDKSQHKKIKEIKKFYAKSFATVFSETT